MDELTNAELAARLRDNAEWCDANEWEIPICMGDDQREAANRLEAMEKELEKGKIGSSFNDFLKEQGTYEETTERAVKRVLAYQLEVAMKEGGLTKVEMAKQLKTSRSQLDRLLDPENDRVTFAALSQAAKAVGRTLRLELQ